MKGSPKAYNICKHHIQEFNMKFILLAALSFLGTGCAAHAHTPTRSVVSFSVQSGWIWVPGHWSYLKYGVGRNTIVRQYRWNGGYWHHKTIGKSYRSHTQGPPPHRVRHNHHNRQSHSQHHRQSHSQHHRHAR